MGKITSYTDGSPLASGDTLIAVRDVSGSPSTRKIVVSSASLNAFLPTQADNAGKVLVTNGTDVSWAGTLGTEAAPFGVIVTSEILVFGTGAEIVLEDSSYQAYYTTSDFSITEDSTGDSLIAAYGFVSLSSTASDPYIDIAGVSGNVFIDPATISFSDDAIIAAGTGVGEKIDFQVRNTGSASWVTVISIASGTTPTLTLTNPIVSGTLQFGTHSALGGESVTGYITVKDSGGTDRKLAVVS